VEVGPHQCGGKVHTGVEVVHTSVAPVRYYYVYLFYYLVFIDISG
jgi:hypothetical protein